MTPSEKKLRDLEQMADDLALALSLITPLNSSISHYPSVIACALEKAPGVEHDCTLLLEILEKANLASSNLWCSLYFGEKHVREDIEFCKRGLL